MYRIISAATMAAFVWTNMVLADDGSGTAPPKRQLVICMNRQMAANRTVSYNDAARFCKELAKDQRTTATGATPAPAPIRPGS